MKRLILAIPLFLISFLFLFSTKSFATLCCPGSGISPSGGCVIGVYQCTGEEPLCDTTTNTCVSEENSNNCGAHNQECCGSVCDSGLVCVSPPQQGRICYTKQEAEDLTNRKQITNKPNPFCDGDESKGINTALGCISINSSNDLVTFILRIATGLGGGIALALILYGVFIVTTSAGMPDKLKAGSETITSAVIGLIFVLLSIFLFRFIGINILGIPGLI